MTAEEKADLARLESTIKAGLSQTLTVGQALAEIRDRQLYRHEFMTFEEYAAHRFKLSKSRAYGLIAAAAVAENVQPVGHSLTSKAAAELAKLPKAEQKAAWDEASEQVPEGSIVPAKVVADAVARRRPAKPKKGRPKPVRIKVPGGTVIVELNKHATGIQQVLLAALDIVARKAA